MLFRLDDLIKLPDSNGNRGRASTRVKILQRGQLAAADALLDTLVSFLSLLLLRVSLQMVVLYRMASMMLLKEAI